MRDYMMRTFQPFLPPGRALELGCYMGDSTAWLTARLPAADASSLPIAVSVLGRFDRSLHRSRRDGQRQE